MASTGKRNIIAHVFASLFAICTCQEMCQSMFGGQVYPQETCGPASGQRSLGHSLQWSQAIISKPAPDWNGTAVVNGKIKDIKLKDYKGKYLVFLFYPLDFTFICPTEVIAFNERLDEFKKINTEVVACSVDSPHTHLAWISKSYGVYLEDLGHTLGLFIIDTKGILRQITMNDLPVGRSVDETLRLVQAFQFTDTHGEVCPANWKPGADTIIPDQTEKLKYFEKHP
ncbi:PRDX4-like protein [Mya arenaria]|uniref:thioredoxin-dependent peroxiredoxin n=1 Tax=Mya arenaria TaxID=6604 RepID=A0ABY7EKC8_MYAAR|nr:PRDX4-like protein [Mya arenaria]